MAGETRLAGKSISDLAALSTRGLSVRAAEYIAIESHSAPDSYSIVRGIEEEAWYGG